MNFPQSDYFTLFGLAKTYSQDKALIKARFYQLQQAAHPDKFANGAQPEKRAALMQSALINEAYATLSSPLKRAIYLLKLQGIDVALETDTAMDNAFLMEQMILREQIAQGDNVSNEINAKLTQCENTLQSLLNNQSSPNDLLVARNVVRQMQFFVRLTEEIEE